MPRVASQDKVYSINTTALKAMTAWTVSLEKSGFVVDGFRYKGSGEIVDAQCVLSGQPQVITPELKAMIEK